MSRPLLLISDIDDTLKRTHRRSQSDTLQKGMRSRNYFVGMPELYLSFCCDGLDPKKRALGIKRSALVRNPDRLVAYVTGAISKFQWFSSLFLIRSCFPAGLYLGREEGTAFEFKLRAIESLVRDFSDHEIILIGDNGEGDPKVFEALSHLGLSSRLHYFVHQVYPDKISKKLTSFVGSLSLAIHFFNRKWISEEALEAVAQANRIAIKEDPQKVMPGWVRSPQARDFWPRLERGVDTKLQKEIKILERYILKRISRRD